MLSDWSTNVVFVLGNFKIAKKTRGFDMKYYYVTYRKDRNYVGWFTKTELREIQNFALILGVAGPFNKSEKVKLEKQSK